jgi:precorrin-2 dehydrogenase/sirohydrochlorin ferrochelatase
MLAKRLRIWLRGRMYPLLLNLQNRLSVVIGGGSVGQRKAASLIAAGGRVRLVCLEEPPRDRQGGLTWLTEPYRSEHLEGATLVFAAATPEVNCQVVAEARSRGIWANAAHDPLEGDFLVPSAVRRGDFLVAVSTSGAAPVFARSVRARLEAQFDDAFGQFVALLAELRPAVLAGVTDDGRRRILFEQLCRWDRLEQLRNKGVEVVRREMWDEVQKLLERGEDQL